MKSTPGRILIFKIRPAVRPRNHCKLVAHHFKALVLEEPALVEFSQLEDDSSIVNIDTLTKDLFTSGLKIWDLEGRCQGEKVSIQVDFVAFL